MSELTENERAATFIGWREGQPCNRRYDEFNQQCSCGADTMEDERHNISAPDMSDARNYMKALETTQTRYHVDCAFGLAAEGHYCDIGDDNGTREPVTTGYGKSWGEAAIAALAALYDAESSP